MKYKNLFLVSVGLLSIFTVSLSFADGLFMSFEELHLYSPQQKAIIAWDGRTEQMVLASRVQADKISNMVWIIPIQSRTKPEVRKSDFSIFKDLISYFKKKEPRPVHIGRYQEFDKDGTARIEVVETKKVDIYDIAILRATSANDLLQWLNANGYKVPEGAQGIIEKYIQRPSMYFVANKIDLANKFNACPKQAQDFYESLKRRLEQKQQPMKKELNDLADVQVNHCPSWQTSADGAAREKEFSACVIEKVKTRFQQMGKAMRPILPDPHFPNTRIFALDDHWTVTLADFDRINNSYFFLRYDNRTVLTDMFPRRQERDMGQVQSFGAAIGQEAFKYADMIHTILHKELAFKKDLDEKNQGNMTRTNDIDQILSVLSKRNPDSFFCEFSDFQYNFPDGERHRILMEAASGIAPGTEIGKTDYCQTITALQEGMATPLKIDFVPDAPYYPLLISSLGEGKTTIDVYVIADGPVSDQNQVFREAKPLALSGKLKDKIIKEFHAGHWDYVTRFFWKGQLKDLKEDAVFVGVKGKEATGR